MDRREEVARVVDPEAWVALDRHSQSYGYLERRQLSLSKADLILALPASGGVEDQTVSQSQPGCDGERAASAASEPSGQGAIIDDIEMLLERLLDGDTPEKYVTYYADKILALFPEAASPTPAPLPPGSEGSGGWRDIESAPRDGTEILLIGAHRSTVAWWGDYNAADSEFGTVQHEPLWGWLGHGDCKNGPVWLRLETYVNPTHWMPIRASREAAPSTGDSDEAPGTPPDHLDAERQGQVPGKPTNPPSPVRPEAGWEDTADRSDKPREDPDIWPKPLPRIADNDPTLG